MYYLIYFLLYLFSLLPLRVLYFISDSIYGLLYHVIKYRRDVVMSNLKIAFPDKTEQELTAIGKGFYHKFIDSMIETVKLLSASDRFFEKRFTGNWELIDGYFDKGRSVQLHMGHNFNWEWGNVVLSKNIRYQVLGVYMPISSRPIDQVFKKIRSRSGTVMLSAYQMAKDFLPFKDKQYCLGLVADQSPRYIEKAKWFEFFGKNTAFTMGPAKNAIRNDTVVVFAFIERPKRGYYHVNFSLAEENPTHSNEDELTKQFVNYLEKVIINNPDMWLWSHRRWKHEWKEEYGLIK